MTDTIIPAYAKYGDIALCHALANLLADVREGKNKPHAARMLDQAMLVLARRVEDVIYRPGDAASK